jgi:molybdopterin-guanine dinucleotide biosynthesis protein A
VPGNRGGCRKELVEAAVSYLRPWFKQLSVACSRHDSCPLVEIPVVTVADTPPVLPRTIEYALRASLYDRLLVTACDPDRIDIGSIRNILRENPGSDAVLSPSPQDPAIPAFGVFPKAILPALQRMIESGDSEF